MPDITLRPARPNEADALSRLEVRSKASHGYDAETMAVFAPVLVVTVDQIARDWVLVAERDGELLGFAHVERRDDLTVAWLEGLFIDPDAQGQGIGTLLWSAAIDHARGLDATELRFDADLHAVGFYERLGATVVGETPSTLIPGRTLPLMRYLL